MHVEHLPLDDILSLLSRRLRASQYTVLGLAESPFEPDDAALTGFGESLEDMADVLTALIAALPREVANLKPFAPETSGRPAKATEVDTDNVSIKESHGPAVQS